MCGKAAPTSITSISVHVRSSSVGDKLYAVGGVDGTDTCLSSAECFDPSTNEWTAVADMSSARRWMAVVAMEFLED